MADTIPDDAFARYVNEIGNVTLDQLEVAKLAQAEQTRQGRTVSLPDILVQQGVLTQTIRQNIECKLQAEQPGGAMQLGRYKLKEKLGEGGMGAVYLAEDTEAQRQVAIKILPPHFARDTDYLQRFRREAKAAARLKHANIVSAVDVGEAQNNHFYVMEYCPGEPLDKLLKRKGRLTWSEALAVTVQVARGLNFAHDNGIIHRDIKPANVFMAKDPTAPPDSLGAARILDLGLAKNIGDGDQSFQTSTGVVIGTPHYISPEQAQGDKNIDGRTDIYSLGATLYHLLTGQPPFRAGTASLVVHKQITEQLSNPQDVRADIPDSVVHILQIMMAKDAADRYASCADLLADLEAVLDGRKPRSNAILAAKSIVRPPQRHSGDDSQATRAGFAMPHASAGKLAQAETVTLAPVSPPRMALYAGGAALVLIVVLAMLPGSAPLPKKTTKTAAAATPIEPAPKPAELPAEIALDVGVGPKIEMVRVRAGEFAMGSNGLLPQWGESPAHRVAITQDFYLGKYEVTVAQFRAFADATKYRTDAESQNHAYSVRDGEWKEVAGVTWRAPGFTQTDNHPVCVISWKDADAYAAWASQAAGRRVFLPSEAQWEYAARGEAGLKYPWGNEWKGIVANTGDKSLRAAGYDLTKKFGRMNDSDDGHPFTAPAGFYLANKSWCGAYDMSGNVWEWCADTLFPYGATAEVDPLVNKPGADRVLRGGAWNTTPDECNGTRRVAPRAEVVCSAAQGFRLAAVVAPDK